MKLYKNEVNNFLEDFEHNSSVEILEEGAEKDELIKSAKKRGILVKDSIDLGVLKTVYAFSDKANSNGAILPSKEFQKKLPQIVGKPMNIGHDRQYIVGTYIDYKYIDSEKKAITYATFFKKIWEDEWEKAKEFLEENKLSSSFEIWSPDNKKEITEDGNYILHDMEIAGGALIFQENGDMPAFKDADVLSMAKKDVLKEAEKVVNGKSLQYASKHKVDDLIYYGHVDVKEKEQKNSVIEVKCSNCGHVNKIASDIDKAEIKCPNCGIKFPLNIDKNKVKAISKIEEIESQEKAEKGGKEEMKKKNEVKENTSEKDTDSKEDSKQNIKVEVEINEDEDSVDTEEAETFKCECLDCGKIIESEKHCSDIECPECGGQMRREERPGPGKSEEQKEEDSKEDLDEEKSDDEALDEALEEALDLIEAGAIDEVIPYLSAFTKEDEKLEIISEFAKSKEFDEVIEEAKKWTVKFINDLPDTAFAVIEPAYIKGDTEDKNARHLPHHISSANEKAENVEITKTGRIRGDTNATVDKSYLQNAKVRMAQINPITDSIKASQLRKIAKAHLRKHSDVLESKEEASTEKKALYKLGIKKIVNQLLEAKEKLENTEAKIEVYKENAIKIVKRREELGSNGVDLSDEDLLNDDKFEAAKLKKENAKLRKASGKDSDVVAETAKDNDYYKSKQAEINEYVEGKKKLTEN